MPANVIIFDADYISELTSKMNAACNLVDEAVASLKQASLHEGWKCKENARIAANIDELNIRLGRLDEGVNETVRVLGGSVSRFAELESKYETQANNLSDELTTNHGFTASTHPSSTGEIHSGGRSGSSTRAAGAGGAAAAGLGAGASGRESEHARRGANIGGASMGMRVPNVNTNINNNQVTNNINIPVTHIPDRPEAAAKGIKDTQEVSKIAVDSVASSITHVLSGSDGPEKTAKNLVEAYNAGKLVADNSASIISNPSISHTEERLAIAAGIVSLAGSTVTGIGMIKGAGLSASMTVGDVGDVSKKAKELLPAVKNISGSNEISNVLGKISGANAASVSSSSNEGESFFDRVIKSFFEKITGENNSSSINTASSTVSPVQEFLNSFIVDWA